jgi:hypothetical protein
MPEAIHVVVVVYGKRYSELLSQIVLANLAAMVREIPEPLRTASAVRILTSASDLPVIESSPWMQVLRRSIRVEILCSLDAGGHDRHGIYGPMVATQRQAVLDAAKANAALFFVGPDQIYSRGAFAHFIRRLGEGYRVIVGPGLRIQRDAVRPRLQALIDASADGSFAPAAEEQVGLLFDYWHPINDQFVIGSGQDLRLKAYLYYRPRKDEVLVRFLQGPTLVAWPRGPQDGFDGFIDHDLIVFCCRTAEEAYVIPDAFECLALDMTDDARRERQPLAEFPAADLLRQLFDPAAVRELQLHCGLRSCSIRRGGAVASASARHEREIARAVDPLIRLALLERSVVRRGGRVFAALFRVAVLVNLSLCSMLVGLFAPRGAQP